MSIGVLKHRHLSPRYPGRLPCRTLCILFACIVAAGAWSGASSAATYQLDSLSYHSDDTTLYVDFLLPMAVLKSKELQAALDDNGLTIECSISIEVRRSRELVSKKPILRTITYSKWYDEYNLEETSKESFTSASYYESMNRYRRFAHVPVIELCFLGPAQNHKVTLEIKVRARPPAQGQSGTVVKYASMVPGPQGKYIEDVAKLWSKKGDIFSVTSESQEFTIETLQRLLVPTPAARGGRNP